MKFGERYVYMDDLAGAAGGGAGGDSGAAAGAGGAGAAGDAAAQSGAAAGAGAGAGDGGAAQGGGGSSALSGGNEWTPDAIPEKFRVKGADGELDLAATVRKVDEHRANLEKRMGAGDIRPKTPDEYKLPDTDVFKNLQLDEAGAKAFRQEAHDMGLSQSQYAAVMGKWATLAPELVNAAQKDTVETATASLKEVWKGDYEANIKDSYRAVSALAAKAGFTYDEVEAAIGNNPVAIRLFAALGPEMREDATPNGAAGAVGGGAQTYEEFIGANWAAYSDPRNPQHKAITARAAQLSARETKGQPAPH
ncbi:hypothetical protein J2W34_000056 [Variovorax boronicumulans]|uniref:hypothetical protein n=1 Tax=Variovorax boronicumulans TaxID=436515 RepID=UPI002781A355|nr:hypothetical protein [Variovorax boronicumulans]MDQ0068282.1 hypothetical protein [Variovorax boronicumulans]